MTQSKHLELGKINCLMVDRYTPHGIFLVSEDEKDVLLPQVYVTDDMTQDSLINVFLYTDSEDRIVATTLKPKAMLGEFAIFSVVDVAPFGAFVDWGLAKDLFVPNMFQKERFKIGDKKFLQVVYDDKTHRLVATEKTKYNFERKTKGIHLQKEVNIVILSRTPLGFKSLVEEKYEGLIYHNEIFEKVMVGEERVAFVKNIRKDGCLDLSLRATGSKQKDLSSLRVLDMLEKNSGMLPYNYKSDAQLIQDFFGLSKKTYKAALTTLQNDGIIEVKDSGIYKK